MPGKSRRPLFPLWRLSAFQIGPLRGGLQPAKGNLLGTGHPDVPRKAELLEQPYEEKPGIEFEPAKPERRRIREGMVIVVPSFAPRQPRHDADISAVVVAGRKRLR